MSDEYSLKDILDLEVGELVNAMYLDLKENDAEEDDSATLRFGNKKFEAELIVRLKKGDVE